VHGSLTCANREDAQQKAIAAGKAAIVCEWIAVSEIEWVGDKRTGEWERVGRWTGDYDGTLE
jgi:hypothetical protein